MATKIGLQDDDDDQVTISDLAVVKNAWISTDPTFVVLTELVI